MSMGWRWVMGLLLVCLAGSAGAVDLPSFGTAPEGASPWVRDAQTGSRVRLLAATATAGDEDRLTLGLEIALQPGWKVYWRDAGDAGYPPRLDWGGSANVGAVEMLYPIPHRFEVLGLQSIGYDGTVIYPLLATVKQPGGPVRLRAEVDYLACNELCVPVRADLALDLPAGPAQASPQYLRLMQALETVPGPATDAGLAVTGVSVTEGDSPRLRVTATADPPFTAPDLFVEGPPLVRFGGEPKIQRRDGGGTVTFTLRGEVTGESLDAALKGADALPLRLTVVDGVTRALGTSRRVSPAGGAPAGSTGHGTGLVWMLVLAVAGGLVLNLMPCVLPVLSLKLLTVIHYGGRERPLIRRGFLASAAGIVASFLALAAALIGLKLAGAAVGWGIQFQQPLFLVFLLGVVVIFAANLAGLFEIPLPAFLGGAGSEPAAHGLAGHFLGGAFATLLATPCSAPFLGTAVGFALARGPGEILLIFAALGVGMSLPYLLVAVFPVLAARLPRPGRWMLLVRRVLALALLATAVWLAWVLARVTGLPAAAGATALLVLAAAVLATALAWRLRLGVAVLAAALAAGVAAQGTPTVPGTASRGDHAIAWAPFAPEQVAALVGEGRTVVVDITAAWCVTCQVNEARTFGDPAVVAALKEPGVVAMRGDWTRPDNAISAFLAQHDRYGIPFNAVYGPRRPEGVVLPELLTPDTLLQALEQVTPL